MTALNRYLYGDTDEVQVTVRETVTVKPGDLMFVNDTASDITNQLAGASAAADYYAYPWAAGPEEPAGANKCRASFIGVAMDDAAKGVTTTVSVATRGVFRFPLATKGSVTIGAIVSGMRPSGFSSTSSTTASYQVRTAGASGGGTIGYCVRTESGASTIDFRIRTLLGDGLVS